MSMGNYLNVGVVYNHVMGATDQPVAVDHPTVVPTNFEPEPCPECETQPCEC